MNRSPIQNQIPAAPGAAPITRPTSRLLQASTPGAASTNSNSGATGASKTRKIAKDGAIIKQKRVRLKPETREQLLERLRNPQLSLHEASILLRVSRATVRRYCDAGRLPCGRTPGGQRRFSLRDIETFYRQLKMKR